MLRLPSSPRRISPLADLGELDTGFATANLASGELGVRIYLCTGPTDMRKGFDTLAALVREHLGHDPLSGHLFLFVGRGRDRIKLLYWMPMVLRYGTSVWKKARSACRRRRRWASASS